MIDERALSLLLAIRARTSARFVHLSQILRNPRTLSAKIRKLENEGLLVSAEGTYRLTEGGLRVAEILEEYTLTVGKRPLLVNFDRVPHSAYSPLLRRYCELLYERYRDISFDGVILFDRDGVMKGFMDSIKSWAKSAGTRRVTLPDGGSYWVMKRTSMGEVVELGKQP